jgi:hypothetical protein
MTELEQAPRDPIGFLDFYLVKKAPVTLPDAAREWIVQWGPWITVVLLILSLPPLLFLLGLGTVLIPFGGPRYAAGFGYGVVVLVVQVGLMVAALPGLFARKMSGWTLLFYSQVASVIFSLLSGSIVGGLLFGLISFYILFQIRPLYRN